MYDTRPSFVCVDPYSLFISKFYFCDSHLWGSTGTK